MNLKSFQKQTLDEIISGWYIQGNEIISSTDPTKSVKYEKFENEGDYLKINTPFGEEIYILKNNNGIYMVEEDVGGYSLLKIGNKYVINRNGKISSEFDRINWKVENGIVYAMIKRDGKYALMRFDGEEKLSDWYSNIVNLKFENEIIYGKVEKNLKYAFIKWDEEEEKLSDWYDDIWGDWRVESGIVYGKVKRNKKWAFMRFNGEEKLSGWYDDATEISSCDSYSLEVENGIVYGIVGKNGKAAFLKFDGNEEKLSDWYNNIWSWRINNGVIYAYVERNGKMALVRFDGEK